MEKLAIWVTSTLLLILIARSYVDSRRLELTDNPHLSSLVNNYEEYLKQMAAQTRTPGTAVVMALDSQVLLMRGIGVREVGNAAPVDTNTVFRIGSLSKGFASILTGILVEDSVLAWDDKVNQHVPQFRLKSRRQSRNLTLRHVLSMTTGLPRHAHTDLIDRRVKMNTVYRYLQEVSLIAKEGTQYSYQNAAYCLIEDAIRAASHQPYQQLMRERIFSPLGMTNASITYEEIIQHPNKALPHYRRGKRWKKRRITPQYYNAAPAGGVNASIADMAKWLQVLMGNRKDIIDSAQLQEIFQPHIDTNNRNRYFGRWPAVEKAYYGLGWRIVVYAGDTLIYHGGLVNGYRSELVVSQRDKIGLCVLTNAPSELPKNCIPVFLEMLRSAKPNIASWDRKKHWFFSLPSVSPRTVSRKDLPIAQGAVPD